MTRQELDAVFRRILGNDHVYYNPPENLKMAFPAIRYELAKPDQIHANNRQYLLYPAYSVTLIQQHTNDFWAKITEIPMCSFDRSYVSDGLHHYKFTIFTQGGINQ